MNPLPFFISNINSQNHRATKLLTHFHLFVIYHCISKILWEARPIVYYKRMHQRHPFFQFAMSSTMRLIGLHKKELNSFK